MDRLPQELLRVVVERTDYKDLATLRTVNAAFAAAAAPSLFASIPLWIGVRSLERLTAISEHPQLSKYPKQIIFSPLRFIDYENDTLYKEMIKDWVDHQSVSLGIEALTMAKHMSAYRSYIEAQRLLSSNSLDVKILSRAFSQLSSLEILHVDYWNMIGANEMNFAFGAFEVEDLLFCDYRQTLPVLIQALATSGIKIKVFKLGSDNDSLPGSFSRHPEDYSTAASRAWPPLSTFMTRRSHPARIGSPALSDIFSDENVFGICRSALGGVRELKVGEIHFEGNDPADISGTVTALRNMMTSILRLETVTLERIWIPFRDDLPIPTISSVMPRNITPELSHLKELNIHMYDADAVSLREIFRLHELSIVKVYFRFVDIVGSNWSAALMQLRTLKFPRLEVFILDHCGEVEEFDLQVQDYILKKTDKDPIVEWIEWMEEGWEPEGIIQQQAAAIATAEL